MNATRITAFLRLQDRAILFAAALGQWRECSDQLLFSFVFSFFFFALPFLIVQGSAAESRGDN